MWETITTAEFDVWFAAQGQDVQDYFRSKLDILRAEGPRQGRPLVDTLNGSKHANMKELRVEPTGHLVRVAFAFDPRRRAILLVAGDKVGVNQKRFYKSLIARADALYDDHLKHLGR